MFWLWRYRFFKQYAAELLLLWAVIMLIYSGINAVKTLTAIRTSVATTARITDYTLVRSGSGRSRSSNFYPIVTFRAGASTIADAQATTPLDPDDYAVGATIPILYNPQNAQSSVMVNTFGALWSGPLIGFVIGILSAAASWF